MFYLWATENAILVGNRPTKYLNLFYWYYGVDSASKLTERWLS